jgi:hypothetical protein
MWRMTYVRDSLTATDPLGGRKLCGLPDEVQLDRNPLLQHRKETNVTNNHTENVTTASTQWAIRPADERFWNLEEMMVQSTEYHNQSYECQMGTQNFASAIVGSEEDGVYLEHDSLGTVRIGHWAFGQLCRAVGAPRDYLASLPATMAADCLRHSYHDGGDGRLSGRALWVRTVDGTETLQALTSSRYVRVPNYSVIGKLMELQHQGWACPPARPAGINGERTRIATENDVIDWGVDSPLTIKKGDIIAPAGLYLSDHDMFAFMVNPERRISDGTDEGLSRGFFVQQSEVGASALKVTSFLMRYVCGNHIVWGARKKECVSLRHTGNIEDVWPEVIESLSRFDEEAASKDEQLIKRAKETLIGDDLEEIEHRLYKKSRIQGLSLSMVRESFRVASQFEDVDGDPRSAWGIAQGMTRAAQSQDTAASRTRWDRTAGRILEMVLN